MGDAAHEQTEAELRQVLLQWQRLRVWGGLDGWRAW